VSDYQTWLDLCCDGTVPDPPFFTNPPNDNCIDETTDVCHECVNGTITGYRYRTAGGAWIFV